VTYTTYDHSVLDPRPILVVEGAQAKITDLRYFWSVQCRQCRKSTEVTTVGMLRIGLAGVGEAAHWYHLDRPGTCPRVELCAGCQADHQSFVASEREARAIYHNHPDVFALIARGWEAVRAAAHPDDARRADVKWGIMSPEPNRRSQG